MRNLLIAAVGAVTVSAVVACSESSTSAMGPDTHLSSTELAKSDEGVEPILTVGNFNPTDGVCSGILGEDATDDMVGFKIEGPIDYADDYVEFEVSGDKYLSWAADSTVNVVVHGVVVKGGPNYHVYNYYGTGITSDGGLRAPLNNGGNLPDISHYDVCYGPDNGDVPQPEPGTLTVKKFYDANANGEWDVGEEWIEGWKINIAGDLDADDLTRVDRAVQFGTFHVREYSGGDGWVATKFETATVVIDSDNLDATVRFGNVCVGGGEGDVRTRGYWQHPNGRGLTGTDFAGLNKLNLRDANGNRVDLDADNFRDWLQAANAENMAYQLSAQLAAMWLNVNAEAHETQDENGLLYAPGLLNVDAVNNAGFISVVDLIAAAVASLADDGNSDRDYQEALKDALDHGNNNETWVQPSLEQCTVPDFDQFGPILGSLPE